MSKNPSALNESDSLDGYLADDERDDEEVVGAGESKEVAASDSSGHKNRGMNFDELRRFYARRIADQNIVASNTK